MIENDIRHFADTSRILEQSISDLSDRLDRERRARGGSGQAALERDLEIHRLTARLRTLRRFGLDLVLGRIVADDGSEPVYVGRFGLTDDESRSVVVDWRSPAAEPFFGATHANPMGLASRRRYRWTRGRITDFWDEVFTPDGLSQTAALDDQSAFIVSLGASRSPRMRDVLGTIQSDQDAIIRAQSRDALVVDGGPGTGKTVVALHRAAYLLYSEPRLARGGVLFVGPSSAYLAYVDDVLPSLGEESVQICTLRDLVVEGAAAELESDARVASLKTSARLVRAVDAAVRLREEPPTVDLCVETPWGDIRVTPAIWADAFSAAEPGTPHNDARDQVWEALLEILLDELREDVDDELGVMGDGFDAYGRAESDPDAGYRRALAGSRDLVRTFGRAWPLLDAADVIADLWSVPAYLRRSAPWLEPEEAAALQREDPRAWTTSDLPFLDAARQRLGDPEASRVRRRQETSVAAERARMADVLDDLIASDDSDLKIMSMLRGQDLQATLVDDAALPSVDADLLAGPFAHVVVDEAQELTDAEWQMLIDRCPSRSFTIVGDRAQARDGFPEQWTDRLSRVGLERSRVASLSINYRTPEEVMAEA